MLHAEMGHLGLPLGGRGATQLAVDISEIVLVSLGDLFVEMTTVVRQQHRAEQIKLLPTDIAGVAQVLDLPHPLAHVGLHPGHVVLDVRADGLMTVEVEEVGAG